MSTRTVQAAPVQSKYNGKWACTFKSYKMDRGEEYLAGELESAAIWNTSDEARRAGDRALEILKKNDIWPNMCEPW